MKRWQIPTFGNWDYSDEMPITQYFESARKAGLVRAGFSVAGCQEDLVNVPVAMPVKLTYQDGICRRKVWNCHTLLLWIPVYFFY